MWVCVCVRVCMCARAPVCVCVWNFNKVFESLYFSYIQILYLSITILYVQKESDLIITNVIFIKFWNLKHFMHVVVLKVWLYHRLNTWIHETLKNDTTSFSEFFLICQQFLRFSSIFLPQLPQCMFHCSNTISNH